MKSVQVIEKTGVTLSIGNQENITVIKADKVKNIIDGVVDNSEPSDAGQLTSLIRTTWARVRE